MTPVFGHGALRLYLLSLLAEAPRHGYELMQALEQRFGGTYSPSAGTIYPRLSKLEEEGLVTRTVDGRRATYAITDAGRAELRERDGELHALESEITDSVRRLACDVRAGVHTAMQALRADLAVAEREARAGARRPAGQAGPGSPQPTGSVRDAGSATTDASHAASRAAARMAVHDIDLALNEFRQQVREAVRRDPGDRATPAVAAAVRAELEAALLRIKALR